jgi:hypothetical protein
MGHIKKTKKGILKKWQTQKKKEYNTKAKRQIFFFKNSKPKRAQKVKRYKKKKEKKAKK